MKRAVLLLAVAAAACSSKDKPSDHAKPKKVDARPRPDAGPPPDAEVHVDAGPAPYVERIPCPYDRQELENAARAAWGPPPDAGVEVYCATAVAPMAAWVLWGHAGLDNRYELHKTLVKASPGHSVLGDEYHRTTDRAEIDPDHTIDTVEPYDLDNDGIDELVVVHSSRRSRYSDPTEATLTVLSLRNGTLVESASRLIVGAPGCFANHSFVGGASPFVEVDYRGDKNDPACPQKGRHRFYWDPVNLMLTEGR